LIPSGTQAGALPVVKKAIFIDLVAIRGIIETSQIIIRGRIAYDPAEKRIYADRAAGGYRDHCFIAVDIDAGIAEG